eukprot:366537-Chlamydomonas_euryale.AAC.11
MNAIIPRILEHGWAQLFVWLPELVLKGIKRAKFPRRSTRETSGNDTGSNPLLPVIQDALRCHQTNGNQCHRCCYQHHAHI